METWREVERGRLLVSDQGRVRRPGGRCLRFKLNDGYREFTTKLDGRRVTLRVHRLVATAFHGPARGRVANHLNAHREDNRARNLEWTTPRGNVAHCIRLGRFAVGERNGNSTLTPGVVRAIRRAVRRGEPVRSLGERFGVSWSQVASVARGQSWSWLR